jgi:pimeloyl-ACP methyl ester carboxylesterase
MKDDSKSILKKNSFEIPAHIIRTGKILQFFSTALATNFALKIFRTPPKFKIPEREAMMRESAKKEIITIPSINKEIMVYEYGYSKRKVLLVHGWSGRGTQLYDIADNILENRMMVVSFDAPAHGLSKGDTTNLPEYVAAINYINEIYGPFEVAIGHSFGGVTLLAALKDNNFIKKLVVIGIDCSINNVIDNFVKKLQLKQKVAARIKKHLATLFNRDIESVSPCETAKYTTIPTLVLHDTQDFDVDVSNAYKIRQNLSNGELLVTNGLGHRRILRNKKVINRIIDFIIE